MGMSGIAAVHSMSFAEEVATLRKWMSSSEVHHVNPQASQEEDFSKTMLVGCGQTQLESLANLDLNSLSWRTQQEFLPLGLETSLQDFPQSGMTRNGTLFLRPMSDSRMYEKGCGLLPTPCARDSKDVSRGSVFLSQRKRHSPSIATQVLSAGRPWTTLLPAYLISMGYPLDWFENVYKG